MHLVFLFTENKWNHFFLCTYKGNKTERYFSAKSSQLIKIISDNGEKETDI